MRISDPNLCNCITYTDPMRVENHKPSIGEEGGEICGLGETGNASVILVGAYTGDSTATTRPGSMRMERSSQRAACSCRGPSSRRTWIGLSRK